MGTWIFLGILLAVSMEGLDGLQTQTASGTRSRPCMAPSGGSRELPGPDTSQSLNTSARRRVSSGQRQMRALR
jgi:hypothetical protein